MYPSPSSLTSSPVSACTVYWKTEPLFRGATSELPSHLPNSRIGSTTSRLGAPQTPVTATKRTTTIAKLPSPSSSRAATVFDSNTVRATGSMRRSKKKRRAESVVPGASQEKVDEGTMRTLGALAKRLTRREGNTSSLVGVGGSVAGTSDRAGALKDTTRVNGNKAIGVAPLGTGKGKEKAVESKFRTSSAIAPPILPLSLPTSKSSMRPNAPTSSSKLTASFITSAVPKTVLTLGTSSASKATTSSKPSATNDDFDAYFPAGEDEGAFELALSQAEEKLSSSQAQAQKGGSSRAKVAPPGKIVLRTSPKKPLPITKPVLPRNAFARPAPAPAPAPAPRPTTIATTTKSVAKPPSVKLPYQRAPAPPPTKKINAPRQSQEDKAALLKKELEALEELDMANWSDEDDF